MFSQFRNVVEGLAQPRLPPGAPRHENTTPAAASLERSQSPSPAKPLTERQPLKAKLEDRLRASFTIGDVSNPSTPSASSRVSPAPQYEHPLSPDIDHPLSHPLSPTSIPLPVSPPPHDRNLPFDALFSSDPSSPPPLLIASHKPVPMDHGTSATTTSDSSNQHSLSDAPVIPQPSEKESEEGIEMDDTTESIDTTDLSRSPVDTVSDAQSVTGSTRAEPELVSENGNSSEPDHLASTDVEALQEQLQLMEQRFAGRSRLLPSPNLFLNLNRRFCVICAASGRKDGRR